MKIEYLADNPHLIPNENEFSALLARWKNGYSIKDTGTNFLQKFYPLLQ